MKRSCEPRPHASGPYASPDIALLRGDLPREPIGRRRLIAPDQQSNRRRRRPRHIVGFVSSQESHSRFTWNIPALVRVGHSTRGSRLRIGPTRVQNHLEVDLPADAPAGKGAPSVAIDRSGSTPPREDGGPNSVHRCCCWRIGRPCHPFSPSASCRMDGPTDRPAPPLLRAQSPLPPSPGSRCTTSPPPPLHAPDAPGVAATPRPPCQRVPRETTVPFMRATRPVAGWATGARRHDRSAVGQRSRPVRPGW